MYTNSSGATKITKETYGACFCYFPKRFRIGLRPHQGETRAMKRCSPTHETEKGPHLLPAFPLQSLPCTPILLGADMLCLCLHIYLSVFTDVSGGNFGAASSELSVSEFMPRPRCRAPWNTLQEAFYLKYRMMTEYKS